MGHMEAFMAFAKKVKLMVAKDESEQKSSQSVQQLLRYFSRE